MAEISLTGDQMITVLETVAEAGPLTAAELARTCNINRTVAHRLLVTLTLRSYVQKGNAGYVIGPAVRRLARLPDTNIVSVSKPVMQKLSDKFSETVVLHCLDGGEATVVDQVVSKKHVVRVEHREGSSHPLARGASGWAILAYQPDRVIKRLTEQLDNPAAALERISQIKANGYALSHDELQIGVSGIAAPVFEGSSNCRASVTVLTPSTRAGLLESFAADLLEATETINDQLRGLEVKCPLGNRGAAL